MILTKKRKEVRFLGAHSSDGFNNSVGWNFPPNNYGQVDGLHNAGIETFKGDPWEFLAREIVQNSLDARQASSSLPVRVRFEMIRLPVDDFPGRDDFIDVLKACAEYWRQSQKTRQFFERALKLMDGPEVNVLKISDFNTTGLLGSSSDSEYDSDWFKLIKSVGISEKPGQAGGSFGIGKHAPFACSQLRTLFYSTVDVKGEEAFQGVARLVTHKNMCGEPTQGVGYYGITNRNRPIRDMSQIHSFFRREEVGTDIFVCGAVPAENWAELIIRSVIENFFVSLLNGILTVEVGDCVIDGNTIGELIGKYYSPDTHGLAPAYCRVLAAKEGSNGVQIFTREFSDSVIPSGRLKLALLKGPDMPKKVAMVRATGMKIFDKQNFRTPVRFAGVLLAEGGDLNEFLRALEPPGHDKWEPGRYEQDERYADRTLKDIYRWINDCVRKLAEEEEVEVVDAPGISQYLPDDADEPPFSETEDERTLEAPPSDIVEVSEVKHINPEREIVLGAEQSASTLEPKGPANRSSGGLAPSAEPEPESPAVRTVNKGRGPRVTLVPRKDRPFKKVRIFCADPSARTYKVTYVPAATGRVLLSFSVVGEDADEPALIKKAYAFDSQGKSRKELQVCKPNKVGPVDIAEGEQGVFLIVLDEPIRCAMEVSSVEDQV